jgi:SnoaL-like polyketide cyclase
MAQDNMAVVRRVVERIWNRGDLALADHLFTTTYVNNGGLIPDLVHGPEAIKVSVAMYRLAFPGLSITINRIEADADMVECGWTAYAVMRALAMRTDHDNSRHTLIGTTSSRLVRGQIAETWMNWDPESRLCSFARTASTVQDS